jgi:hypothetical protein
MGAIYSQAEEVVVWLGKEAEDSGLAIHTITSWANLHNIQDDDLHDRALLERRRELLDPKAVAAIVKLTNRPWFTRLWVFQELVLAKVGVVVCGSDIVYCKQITHASMEWSRITNSKYTNMLQLTATEQDALRFHSSKFAPFYQNLFHQANPNSKALSMVYLMAHTKFRESTDPRDKVYGILGLGEGPYMQVEVSYTKPVGQVYKEFFQSFVQLTLSLKLLVFAGICRFNATPSLGLPSWTPDFRPTFFPADPNFSPTTEPNVRVSGARPARAFFSADLNTLNCYGVDFDVLHKIDRTPHTDKQHWRKWRDLALSSDSHQRLGESYIHQALFRTMIRDVTTDEELHDTETRHKFLQVAIGFMMFLGQDALHEGYMSNEILRYLPEIASRNWPPWAVMFLLWSVRVPTPPQDLTLEWILEPFLGPPNSILRLSSPESRHQSSPVPYLGNTLEFIGKHVENTEHMDFFVTPKGYMGLCPISAREGDRVCILDGCNSPVLLRETGSHFVLVGECYVYGIMFGEIVPKIESGELPDRLFVIR